MKRIPEMLEKEILITRHATILWKCIDEFAVRVAKRWPPGSEVEFQYYPIGETTHKKGKGIVSECQFTKESLPSTGLVVVVSENVASQIQKHRHLVNAKCEAGVRVLVTFYDIEIAADFYRRNPDPSPPAPESEGDE